MSDALHDLQERLAKLEEQVNWLVQREKGREAALSPSEPALEVPHPPRAYVTKPVSPRPAPPLRPQPVMPPPPPREPSKPMNPIVVVAAVGSGIFLLGSIFFLHVASQRGWIGPEMRFLLGLVVGAALTLGAAKMILGQSRKIGTCLLLAGIGTLMFTLRWGSIDKNFMPVFLGFGGTGLAALFAGGLAARTRFAPPLWVALIAGFIAPLAFSQGGHHEVALTVYLAVLVAATLAVPYLAGVGARWGFTRWFALVGTWILVAVAVGECQKDDALTMMGLLALHYALAGLWIWLPGVKDEKPTSPTLMWFLVSLAMTSLCWVLWSKLHWTNEWFAGPTLILATINLALVKPLRERLGGRQADLGLLVLAAGHLALAVPIAMDWKWVGPMWGLFALGLAWAVKYADEHPDWEKDEVRALLILALGMVSLGTLRWVFHSADIYGHSDVLPFFNKNFAEGALVAAAWGLLARRGGAIAVVGFIGLELLGNITLALELSRLVSYSGGTNRAASTTMTLVFALSGALQWLRSLSEKETNLRRALAAAGYVWLGFGSFKLIVVDMEHADTLLRALAFLGVGAIFLTAALVANRARIQRKEGE